MKTASFLSPVLWLAWTAAATLIGCSPDNTLPTQPINNADTHGMVSVESSGTIHLDTTLADPLNKTVPIEVIGDVNSEVQTLPSLGKNDVSVAISFQGQAISSLMHGPVGWSISGKTVQTITLDPYNRVPVEHTYAIQGSTDNLVLNVEYLVSNTQVQIQKISLEALKSGS